MSAAARVTAAVLVVEDDRTTADLIARYLLRDGHRVTVEHAGDAALKRIRDEHFDLLILDVMLPGASGLDIARAARAAGSVPIVFVTARAIEEQRIEGFRIGADDYVTKPFSPGELAARVQALLRRVPPAGTRVFTSSDLVVDCGQMTVRVGEVPVTLTRAEFTILESLVERPGHVRSRTQLVERIGGGNSESTDRTVDVHVSNLRRKLDAAGNAGARIQTVVGSGYRLVVPARQAHEDS